MAGKLWDVQSKASKDAYPKDIGRELVTLYKNYISGFGFSEYILFLGAVPNTFRKDNSINIFQIDNIQESACESVRSGLLEECQNKTYIDNSAITNESIDGLLNLVWFVVDDTIKSLPNSDIPQSPSMGVI